YFNFNLIFYRGQVWRLVTNFLFFGLFSLDFLFHMYFLVRYSRMLEEGSFRGRTADFLYMIMFGAVFMILVAPFVSVHFLGSSLTFMMVYIWGRRNEHTQLSFLGLFPFTAPYLPWVLLLFSMVLGNSATIDLIGIVVGHIYYFFEDVYPTIADIRGWRVRRVLKTPAFVKFLCNPQAFTMGNAQPNIVNDVAVENIVPDDQHLHQD
ncbi:Der1-like family, partial [Thraustotheca clavata]